MATAIADAGAQTQQSGRGGWISINAALRDVSPSTVAAYRDTFRLLLAFVERHTGSQPFQLDLADLDAPLIGAFLTHLEQDRHNNTSRTRNARLTAIHSFYRYAALRHPEHLDTIAGSWRSRPNATNATT